jgi:hypothetical protein
LGIAPLEALGHEIEICHINGGHAALAAAERARRLAKRHAGPVNGHIYVGQAPASRRADDCTVRATPCHDEAAVPAELALIA